MTGEQCCLEGTMDINARWTTPISLTYTLWYSHPFACLGYEISDCQYFQCWTKLNKSGGGPWPQDRSCHAAVCLNYGQRNPQLLISGGLDRQNKQLADVWILDVETGSWRMVRIIGNWVLVLPGHSIHLYSGYSSVNLVYGVLTLQQISCSMRAYLLHACHIHKFKL